MKNFFGLNMSEAELCKSNARKSVTAATSSSSLKSSVNVKVLLRERERERERDLLTELD